MHNEYTHAYLVAQLLLYLFSIHVVFDNRQYKFANINLTRSRGIELLYKKIRDVASQILTRKLHYIARVAHCVWKYRNILQSGLFVTYLYFHYLSHSMSNQPMGPRVTPSP